MRRTLSVRNRTTHNVTPSDDLGTLREASEQSIEDVLRHELASVRRENDRLQSQIESLNVVLRSRPPIERVQELEREFNSLELLLHGTQRENERAMAELERAKNREKLLEKELRKFVGEDWEESLNLSTAFSSVPTVRPIGSSVSRSAALEAASSCLVTPLPTMAIDQFSTPSSADATLEHMKQIRTMLLGMAERLQSGEEKLQQLVDRAEEEERKLEGLSTNNA